MRAARLALALAAALAVSWILESPAWAARAVVDWPERSVNVRAGPELTAKRIGHLPRGTEVEVLGSRGEWARVRHAAGEGWVVERSLRRLPELSPPQAAAAVSGEPEPEARAAPSAPSPLPVPESAGPEAAAAPPAVPAPAATPGVPAEEGPRSPDGYLTGLEETPLPPYDTGSGLLNVLAGLLVVLALLAGLVWVARRVSGSRLFPGGARASPIRVLATRGVGPRQGLVLVEIGGLVWLLSQGPEGLRLVGEIRDEAALVRLDQRYGFRETPFEATLRTRLDLESGVSGAPGAEGPEPTPEERLAALRRRPPAGGPS